MRRGKHKQNQGHKSNSFEPFATAVKCFFYQQVSSTTYFLSDLARTNLERNTVYTNLVRNTPVEDQGIYIHKVLQYLVLYRWIVYDTSKDQFLHIDACRQKQQRQTRVNR